MYAFSAMARRGFASLVPWFLRDRLPVQAASLFGSLPLPPSRTGGLSPPNTHRFTKRTSLPHSPHNPFTPALPLIGITVILRGLPPRRHTI